MILSCPACQTRFVIDPAALGETGRKVRCAKCGDRWHQAPEAAVDTAPPPAAAAKTTDVEAEAGAEAAVDADINGDPVPDTEGDDAEAEGKPGNGAATTATDSEAGAPAATEGRAARRARARTDRQAGPAKRKGGWIGWLILLLVLMGLAGAGFYYRQGIVEIWPPAGRLFELAGLGPEAKKFGLTIQNVEWEYKPQKGQRVLVVRGEVANTSEQAQAVPRLRVVIRDERGRRLFRWTVTAARNSLEPGQTVKFSTRLANPPESARSLAVTFLVKP